MVKKRSFFSVLVGLVFLFSVPSLAQQPDAMLQFQLADQLKRSAALWNRGDIDGFLNDYLDSPNLTFTSGGRILKGFDALVQRYRRSYGNTSSSMGQLSFSDMEVWRLGSGDALVLGRWRLERNVTGTRQVDEGVFTLVMVQSNGEWKILHDHTSASQ